MNEAEREEALRRFGYTKPWLDSGVITPEILARQIEARDSDAEERDREGYEHYRFRALSAYLGGRNALADGELAALLAVAEEERLSPRSDKLHNVVYVELIGHPGLTDAQFDKISEEWHGEAFQRAVRRHRLLRGLRQGNREAGFIGRCLHDGDTVVHRQLLVLDCMNLSQLTWLAQNAVKEIRRDAQVRLLDLDNLSPALTAWLTEKGVNKDIQKRARRKHKGLMQG